MMDFVEFAMGEGVIINELVVGGLRRCGTVSHPKGRNGAYRFEGTWGWVQNWEQHLEPVYFRTESRNRLSAHDRRDFQRRQLAERKRLERRQQGAAQHAGELLRSATSRQHDYLFRKGFKEMFGLTLSTGELIVPMREFQSNELVGLQLIRWDEPAREWTKRFLPGTKLKGAVIALGRRRATEMILCEGYATGLSVQCAVRKMALDVCVLVCFSAANMIAVARTLRSGLRYCFADNDASKTGEKAAQEAGLPYCMSPQVGEDANDLHVRAGVLEVCKVIMTIRTANVTAAAPAQNV
jgi:phage/plasmid primase-like uncharacterized protein